MMIPESVQRYWKSPEYCRGQAVAAWRNRRRYEETWRRLLAGKEFGSWTLMERVMMNVRGRIQSRAGRAIPFTTEELLGCVAEDLMRHLQGQFSGGLEWANYGLVWAIDHRVPLAQFDLSRNDELKQACHYTNLQPLSKRMNSVKRGDIVPYAPKTANMPVGTLVSRTRVGIRGGRRLTLIRQLVNGQS